MHSLEADYKSEVFLPLPWVSGFAQSLAGLWLPVLSILVLVSVRYSTPRPPVRLGCGGCCGNLNEHYIRRPSPIERPKTVLNRLPL